MVVVILLLADVEIASFPLSSVEGYTTPAQLLMETLPLGAQQVLMPLETTMGIMRTVNPPVQEWSCPP